MSGPEDMAARHGRMLAEIQEIALAAARDLGAALAEAPTPAEKAVVMGALHRAGRCLRQSIALEARLVRDAARAVREAQEAARAEVGRKVERRRAQVRAVVERLIWTEHEKDEDEALRLEDSLDDLLAEDACFDEFLTDPVALQIERLCTDLGLDPAALRGADEAPPHPSPACAPEPLAFDAAPEPPSSA